jgi:hypothetical protein
MVRNYLFVVGYDEGVISVFDISNAKKVLIILIRVGHATKRNCQNEESTKSEI